MLPPRTRLDPEGFYARLGLEPAAQHEAIISAFRAKARMLHPDVPATGDAAAFVAMKQAYDVLSNRTLRGEYDRRARQAAEAPVAPEPVVVRPMVYPSFTTPLRQPRFSDLPILLWAGIGAFMCLCIYEITVHLMAPPNVVTVEVRPNAARVEALSPSAQRAVLYGPVPVQLAGVTNFYVTPSGSPAILWRFDPRGNKLVSIGQLPPFSAVQAIRFIRDIGMLEVLVNNRGNGFISADHLTPGNQAAARQAYCGYNAGDAPADGELLERRGTGKGTLALQNRAMQPAVVKLRDRNGSVVISVFLEPGSHADLAGLPEGLYRPEFAVGEMWSRACNTFAAGMQARRLNTDVRVPHKDPLVVDDADKMPGTSGISDQAFGRD